MSSMSLYRLEEEKIFKRVNTHKKPPAIIYTLWNEKMEQFSVKKYSHRVCKLYDFSTQKKICKHITQNNDTVQQGNQIENHNPKTKTK